ncbi:tRNA lysidine(34) synthetase TilS [Desulfovibrio aminophilus]|nr:tRNA lysidine(34) synthetase TilS [Desulfovibrio aminophilus]MCM0754345.1 tRNA lysidine(34) synthetase TilS [Desulfovibrio aminophilus]
MMAAPLPRTLQDLPPRWAHFCLGIERFTASDLGVSPWATGVLVAFSGGLDSTALLLAALCLTARNGGWVRAAHLDHGLRPESGEDAQAVLKVCEAVGVPCVVRRVDVAALAAETGAGLEDAGREARLEFLREVRAEAGTDWILLGHHLDDLAEDVLLRLVRGTGWPGLSGMPGRDVGRRLLRPLLLTPKSALRDFLTDLSAPWREDASNQEPLFRRNRMRHAVLPLLLEENPAFLDSMARLWRMGRQDEEFWDAQVSALFPVGAGGNLLLADATLEAAPPALRLRLYKRALDALGPGQALAETLFQLDDAWRENRLGCRFQFPGDKLAQVTREGLFFSKKS